MVVAVGHLLPKQFKYVLAMIVPHHTVLVSIAYHQSLLLKLVAISESDKSALRETEKVDAVKIVFQLESQVFSLVLLFVDFVQVLILLGRDGTIRCLNKIGELSGLLLVTDGRSARVSHELLGFEHFARGCERSGHHSRVRRALLATAESEAKHAAVLPALTLVIIMRDPAHGRRSRLVLVC